MPIYRYRPAEGSCRICGEGFDLQQGIDDPRLEECPTCGRKVIREAAQAAFLPKHLAPLSVSQAKQAGFTVLRRTGDGSFEKT